MVTSVYLKKVNSAQKGDPNIFTECAINEKIPYFEKFSR